MSYTCPDCEDGVLVAKVREIQIMDDETAEIVDGRVRIASVACNNGCSSASEEEEEEKPKTRKKRAAAAGNGELCAKTEDCSRENSHRGMCNHRGKATE